jgi:flagellin-like hook-associated protein FlgL
LTVQRSDVGVRQNQADQYSEYAQNDLYEIEDRLGKISGGDLESAVLKMTEAQNAYQAALASFAKALPQSLLDYLR